MSGSWPLSVLAHCQMPMPWVQCVTASSMVQPLRARVLAGDDDVDVVAAADAVVKAAQQAVGIGGQVEAHDVRLLVGDVVEEAGVPDG